MRFVRWISCEIISIHALREEGDLFLLLFQLPFIGISIHALREEGDLLTVTVQNVPGEFLSTPSARRATEWKINTIYSGEFLSTPSARRATA